jgi:hypothetical protein
MSAWYDIAINLTANAIWAFGGFVIGKLVIKKSFSRTAMNRNRPQRTVQDKPPFNQGSYKLGTKVSLLDGYDLDVTFLKRL